MGGVNSPGFRAFKELAVKAFLACRPFVEEVCATVKMMMATDLPSFTGEGTIDRLRDRFKPHMTEVEAAHHMRGVIANAQFSQRSILYDRFQVRCPYHSPLSTSCWLTGLLSRTLPGGNQWHSICQLIPLDTRSTDIHRVSEFQKDGFAFLNYLKFLLTC